MKEKQMIDTLMSPDEEHLSKLVGAKITCIIRDGAIINNEECWGFTLDDKRTVWILKDAEGNGPGYLQINSPPLDTQ